MTEASRFSVSEIRPLTDREHEVIGWLLDHSERGGEFRDQVDRMTVCSKCTCGCPTIDFAFEGAPVSRKGERVISDHLAEMDGEPFGVMLFASDGKLSTLEVYSQTGNVTSFGLPAIEQLFRLGERRNDPRS
jgi:hypothetical protein